MIQSPANYYGVPTQNQPSYNAVKIDIHNPKVTDGAQPYPQYGQPYGAPNGVYSYPQAVGVPCYPAMPQINPYIPPQLQNPAVNTFPQAPVVQPAPVAVVPQPMVVQQQAPVAGGAQPQPVVVNPAITVPEAQATQQAAQPVVQQVAQPTVQPVPVVPVPVQQVINNGVPATQTITQNPVAPNVQTQPVVQAQPNVKIETPVVQQPDITPVLKGLQSSNMLEQSEALSKIGEIAENPAEVKKYLDVKVLDSLLAILNSDTSKLEPPTQQQIDARTKLLNEQALTEEEKNLAMTLSPLEVAERNKQHAMYSVAIIQKALANEYEAKTGEKLAFDKLPAIDLVLNVVKENSNPLLRASALVALAHLDNPEYKPVLSEIFSIAQNDNDPNVKKVATEALTKIQSNPA